MTFSEAVQAFSTSLPGTDSYVALRQSMQLLVKNDPDNASAYFLIFGFARTYVMLYEDQEVSPVFAEENKQLMLSYLYILEDALNKKDAKIVYHALNEVVSAYENSKKIF